MPCATTDLKCFWKLCRLISCLTVKWTFLKCRILPQACSSSALIPEVFQRLRLCCLESFHLLLLSNIFLDLSECQSETPAFMLINWSRRTRSWNDEHNIIRARNALYTDRANVTQRLTNILWVYGSTQQLQSEEHINIALTFLIICNLKFLKISGGGKHSVFHQNV